MSPVVSAENKTNVPLISSSSSRTHHLLLVFLVWPWVLKKSPVLWGLLPHPHSRCNPLLTHMPALNMLSLKQPVNDFSVPKSGMLLIRVFVDLDSVTSHSPCLPPASLAVPSGSPLPVCSTTIASLKPRSSIWPSASSIGTSAFFHSSHSC